jgi:YebC/PmpR family DNA-binding regulatory protein
MSGHSKWATIKRKKGAADAKRGQVFTRLTREIVMAARDGGGDVNSNFRLRLAIEKARAQNMPKDNIDRAIKRGTGESKEGNAFEQILYEGYAGHGVACMIEVVTDNRNRSVAEIRHVLSRGGGNLGEGGSVAWQFNRIAYFSMPAANNSFDKVFELAVECGAEDVTQEEDEIEIFAPLETFKTISDRLQAEHITIDEAELRFVPTQEMEMDVDKTVSVMKILDALEELDDVQSMSSNLHITEEAMAAMENE